MHTWIRLLATIALALAATLPLSGCRHAVTFPEHAPYSSGDTYPGYALVVIPADFPAKKIVVNQPGWGGLAKHELFYGQALRTELMARFQKQFRDGVRFIGEEDLTRYLERRGIQRSGEATADPSIAALADSVAGTDPLEAPAGATEERDPADGEAMIGMEDLQAISDAQLDEYIAKPPRVILRVPIAQAGIDGDRAVIRFDGEILDGKDGSRLSRRTYAAPGKRMMPTATERNINDQYKKTMIDACFGAIASFSNDVKKELAP